MLNLRHCDVACATPHSEAFASLAAGAFCCAISGDNYMHDQLEKYAKKLASDRSAVPERIAVAAKDDEIISWGDPHLAGIATQVLERLSALSLVVAAPSLPFADLLVRRA